MDRVFDIFLKNCIKFVIVDDALARKADDQAAVFRAVYVVDPDQMEEQLPVIILRDAAEAAQRQYAGCQLARSHFPAGGQGAHGLVIQEAVGQPVCARRLHETLFYVQLDQCDPLDQVPGDAVRQHGARFRMILPHDKPHLGWRPASSGTSHTLQKAGNRKRRIDLECPFQPAYVDAELQGGGGADAEQRVIVLHFFFGALAVGGGEITVVNEKTVGLPLYFTVLAQVLADRFAFFPGIGEYEAFFAGRMLEYIADAGIGSLRGPVRDRFGRRRFHGYGFALISLGRLVVKMLHAQPPDFFSAADFRDDGSPAAAGSKKLPRGFGIAYGCGQADPPGTAAGQGAHALDQAESLEAPVRPHERVDLIDDDETKVAEEGGDFHMLVDHQGFQRFRGDLQDPGRLSQKFSLPGLRHISVPAVYGYVFLLAELVQPAELVIDQCLERRYVQDTDSARRVLVQKCQDREKCRFRLSGCCGGSQEHIFFSPENGFACRILHTAQILPAAAVYVILNKWSVAFEYIHRVNSVKPACVSSETASDPA